MYNTDIAAFIRDNTIKDSLLLKHPVVMLQRLSNVRYKNLLAKESNENKNIKDDLRSSTRKKVPNFAKIHKKLFAKSESVVDSRKRLAERHTALTTLATNDIAISKGSTLKMLNSNKNLPSRFKIRLNDATNSILKKNKQTNADTSRITASRLRTREFLKGVRTNRRFELQMISRNIKS